MCFVELLCELLCCDVYCYGLIFEEFEILVWLFECNSLVDLCWCVVCGGLCFGGRLFEGIVLGL